MFATAQALDFDTETLNGLKRLATDMGGDRETIEDERKLGLPSRDPRNAKELAWMRIGSRTLRTSCGLRIGFDWTPDGLYFRRWDAVSWWAHLRRRDA